MHYEDINVNKRSEVPKNGAYHIIWYTGSEEWIIDDKLHREDDPAYTCNDGYKAWYQNGNRHRINKPARIYPNGNEEYWYDNKEYTKQEYFDLMLDKGLISEKEYFSKLL